MNETFFQSKKEKKHAKKEKKPKPRNENPERVETSSPFKRPLNKRIKLTMK
jgi:hypothetical protein